MGWTLGSLLLGDANKAFSLIHILYKPIVHRLFAVANPSSLPLDDQNGLNADFNIVLPLLFTNTSLARRSLYLIQKKLRMTSQDCGVACMLARGRWVGMISQEACYYSLAGMPESP